MSKIIFMGTPDFSTKILEMLIAEHEVIAVVTQPDRPVGRKKVMTVKKLVKSTHPILNKTIQPVSTYDQKLKVLLEDLEDTLYHEEAAAISAPQIGVDQSVALIDMEQEGLLQLINPVVKSQSQETVSDLEGSISLPHIYGEVKRSKMITVQ